MLLLTTHGLDMKFGGLMLIIPATTEATIAHRAAIQFLDPRQRITGIAGRVNCHHQCIAWYACLSLSVYWYRIILLGNRGKHV